MHEFKFLGFEIENIDFHKDDGLLVEGEDDDLTLGYGIEQADNNPNVFKLYLGALVEHNIDKRKKTLSVDVKVSGLFEFMDKEISRENAENTLKVNGSSILFPYVRSLVQMLTSYDCTDDRIMFPPINMAKIISDIDERRKGED